VGVEPDISTILPHIAATLPLRVAGKRHALAGVAAVAIVAWLALLAGCGGGGDEDTSTSAGVPTVPQVTSPAPASPDRGASTTRTVPGTGQAAPSGSGQVPPGQQGFREVLAPFRECLDQRGVSLAALRPAGGGPPPGVSLAEYKDQAEKAFTCIPRLPPQLRERAELLKRRFEQRYGG
jgi:hypothetical protein